MQVSFMPEVFITSIEVHNVRNIEPFTIPLDRSERKHLIITGKNGSGKSTLVQSIAKFLAPENIKDLGIYSRHEISLAQYRTALSKMNQDDGQRNNVQENIEKLNRWFVRFGGVKLNLKNGESLSSIYNSGNFVTASFQSKRRQEVRSVIGPRKLEFKEKYTINDNASTDFIQYLVNLRADRSFANEENDQHAVQKVDLWFDNFENSVGELFDNIDVRVEFDRKNYNFIFRENGKEPYDFNQLSDGYSAVFRILTEVMMRMEMKRTSIYDVQGVVLIDEIETHLHVYLQKTIFPFLIRFFPRLQFIVTTHSPFVLNSVDNAIICDLEKRTVIEDLSGYSYDTLIESYFNSDNYSTLLKQRVDRYEELVEKSSLSQLESEELIALRLYMKAIPKFVSDELAVRLNLINLKALGQSRL